MASLKETAELAWRQLFPNPGDETALEVEEFIATAKSEYAYQMQLEYWAQKQREGEAVMPSHLITEVELPVKENRMDISKLNIFRNFFADVWLVNVGGIGCGCLYIKSDANMSQLLCGDDSKPDEARTYYPQGKEIIFPRGVHKNPLPIIYANRGDELDDDIEIDDGIAAIVRTRLIDIYGGKTGTEDVTNNTNSKE